MADAAAWRSSSLPERGSITTTDSPSYSIRGCRTGSSTLRAIARTIRSRRLWSTSTTGSMSWPASWLTSDCGRRLSARDRRHRGFCVKGKAEPCGGVLALGPVEIDLDRRGPVSQLGLQRLDRLGVRHATDLDTSDGRAARNAPPTQVKAPR